MKLSSSFICANHEIADFDHQLNAPMFRKTFELDSLPKNAELTICGLGFYELYINGINITKGPLSPYISNTDHVCYYDLYDIKQYLEKGKNTIGVILGNGFRNCFGGFVWDFEKAQCRGPVTLALYCEIDDIAFESDSSFKTHPSPIIFNDLRMGYQYDARLEIPDWAMPDFDDYGWDNAVLCLTPPKGERKLSAAPPIIIKDELYPVSVTFHEKMPFSHADSSDNSRPIERTIRENIYLFDFGKNMSGVTKLHIKNALPGQKITIRHGEILINNEFSMSNLMFCSAEEEFVNRYIDYAQYDVYICRGGDETFVPKFKYDGFRYAYVEGLLPEQLQNDTLTYLVEYTDTKERAGFGSSDEILNALFDMTRNSTLSNMVHIPTDCPHREKNGWTGDVSVSAEHFLLNTDCVDFLSEWLYNVSKAQTENGDFPAIVPTGDWGYGEPYAGPVWDSVCINIPYAIYKYTGDKKIITDNADFIMRYFNYLKTRLNENGLFSHGLGDWVDPLRRYRTDYATAAPVEVTSSIAVYRMLVNAAFLFKEANLIDKREQVTEFSQSLKKTIRKKLIDFDTYIVDGNCQTSQGYAIWAEIFEENEIDRAKTVLLDMIKHDKMLMCGMIGRRFIFDILTDMGETDWAYKLIVSRDITSYANWVLKGYTTLCESFTPDGIKVDSRNHHFLGDISRWMIERVAGIRINPTCLDVTSFEVAPSFPSGLSFANAYFDYESGRLSVSWERQGENIILKVIVPSCCHGVLTLPKGYTTTDGPLTEGEYTFTIIKEN